MTLKRIYLQVLGMGNMVSISRTRPRRLLHLLGHSKLNLEKYSCYSVIVVVYANILHTIVRMYVGYLVYTFYILIIVCVNIFRYRVFH